MASPFCPLRFVREESSLASVLFELKVTPCPYCRQTGALIGHGFLRGYAETSSEVAVRGRRVFCSNRRQRPGCGRSYSVLLSTVISGFVVRTLALFRFVSAVVSGLTRRAARLSRLGGLLSRSSAYRLWQRLHEAQSTLRARLSAETPAPACSAREPLAQLLTHVGAVVGAADNDPLEGYQRRMQRGIFER